MKALAAILFGITIVGHASGQQAEKPWRSLPLIDDGRVDKAWAQVGWGSFVVDGEALRTECDDKGMGLLLYEKEKFGNCQLRVVFKCKDARSNAGVFVRIDDGIRAWTTKKVTAVQRGQDGKLSKEMLKKLEAMSESGEGPWYAVHHGYEVQIMDSSDPFHRTGAIYSLARSSATPRKTNEWRTLLITLKGNTILVDVDGERVTTFDPESKDVPKRTIWHEPRRDTKRPQVGYIGLQNHDPGDVVWFKEIAVRELAP